MERSMLLLILGLTSLWLILDDIYGKKRVTRFVKNLVSGEPSLVEKAKEKIEEEQEKDKSTATGIPKDAIDSILTPPLYD